MTKPVRQVSVLADAVLRQLQVEALQQYQPDDDTTYPPDPLSSAQARRAAVAGVVA